MVKKEIATKSISYTLLVIGTVLMLFPFLWMLSTAFKDPTDIYSLSLIPKHITFANVTDIWQKTMFDKWFINSMMIALLTTLTVAFLIR
ncbi:hypothetical protein [Paenibacillus sp. N3.4]|uniref:hypothetical protein n=1 Tax=Paenibacillus sp. N3.4 TaxID=2603222 RepID=UPI0011CC2C90|nr:hypothetical protein [Paenibacillus sp. N3.4]TXK78399.1 hypothetical protein FU659_20555 [Paenibacillus sp. N3.4]